MPLYSKTVQIAATAYVLADSEEEAQKAYDAIFKDNTAELPTGDAGDFEVCGDSFDSADLPEVSLSPAITLMGQFADDTGWEVAAEDDELHQGDEDACRTEGCDGDPDDGDGWDGYCGNCADRRDPA